MGFIQSNFGTKRNFEVVMVEGGQLVHYWRDNDDAIYPWTRRAAGGSGASGVAALIQSRNFGSKGNFEVVVREGNQLRHYWRDNDDGSYPWKQGALFGANVASSPCLIQSNFGGKGNFEVVVREGNQLRHYWRDNDNSSYPWKQGALFGANVASSPCLIQSNFGSKGNFEVVVREGNQLRHYWRDNDNSSYPWNTGALFGSNVGSAPTLIRSNFGSKGNFEVLVSEGNRIRHYWRDNDNSSYPWNTGAIVSDHITDALQLLQSNFGSQGNFELVTRRGNCLVHFWRNNDDSSRAWSDEIETHSVPPAGAAPTLEQLERFLGAFPSLRNWTVTAPRTGAYNCIAWSVGVTDEWLWPGDTVAIFDTFYASYGWTPAANGNREYGKRKVALWADSSGCTHGSRECYDCDWSESKCGGWERIAHDKFQMQGGAYGNIIKYYEKADPGANLDLA